MHMARCAALLRAQGHLKWWSRDQVGDDSAKELLMNLKTPQETATADWPLGALLNEILK